MDETAVRNTRDVDVLLRRHDSERAASAMATAGFLHRRVSSLGKSGHMDVFLAGPDAKVRDAVHVVWAAEAGTAESEEVSLDVSESEEAGDFRLVLLPELVRMKLVEWRDKDRMHLHDLKDVGLIDESLLPSFTPLLQTRLKQILAGE